LRPRKKIKRGNPFRSPVSLLGKMLLTGKGKLGHFQGGRRGKEREAKNTYLFGGRKKGITRRSLEKGKRIISFKIGKEK